MVKQLNRSNKVALVLPYYGKWPVWMDAFLHSSRFNPELRWIIFSDLKYPSELPENVKIIPLKKEELSDLIFEKTGIKHSLANPHKLCDFKPLFGHIFEAYLTSFTYWGHCDMDIIWGDISAFLKSISFENYDIISTRKHVICGHFNLYRNISEINLFYQQVPHYQKAFQNINYQGFDEGFFSYHLFVSIQHKRTNFKVFWNGRNCIDRGELQRIPNGWYWKNGKIRNNWGREGTYLHMIDWKQSLINKNLSVPKNINYFKINRLGIWPNGVPWKVRRLLLFNQGWKHQLLFLNGKLFDFVRYRLMKKKKSVHPNVLPQYQILN